MCSVSTSNHFFYPNEIISTPSLRPDSSSKKYAAVRGQARTHCTYPTNPKGKNSTTSGLTCAAAAALVLAASATALATRRSLSRAEVVCASTSSLRAASRSSVCCRRSSNRTACACSQGSATNTDNTTCQILLVLPRKYPTQNFT